MTDKSSSQNYIDTWKGIVAITRDLIILVIIILMLLFPKVINSILYDAGIEEGNIGIFKWKSGLAKSESALREANVLNEKLKNQLERTNAILDSTMQHSANLPDTLKNEIREVQANKVKLDKAYTQTSLSVNSAIRSNVELVKTAQLDDNNSTKWGIVYGADLELAKSVYEVDIIAKKLKIPNAGVYFRQGYYRSVSVVADRTEAEEILRIARLRRQDAYIVSMSSWCPTHIDRSKFIECSTLAH